MTAIDLRDDLSSVTSDPGLVHLASQVVQLFWSENNPGRGPAFPAAARQRILQKAGRLLQQLSEDTAEHSATQPQLGALPSPSDLQASSCLLEAWQDAALDSQRDLRDAVLGDERFAEIEAKLVGGQLPSSNARQELIKLFGALAKVAARRKYESPLHDLR